MNSPGIKTLVLEGTPSERGRHHGEELRGSIHEGVRRWKDHLYKLTGVKPNQYIRELVEKTDFVNAAEKRTPRLVQEVKGIGEGSGLDFHTIFAWQLLDERWWYESERNIRNARASGEECSAVGIFRGTNNVSLLGQNMDLPCLLDGLQVLLHVNDPEVSSEALIFSLAGLIALNGVNKQGIGVCVNTLSQLSHANDGLPVAFIIRSILEQPSINGATAFVRGIKHASGENYMIGGAEGIVDLECSASCVAGCEPSGTEHDGKYTIIHTNHPLVSNDQISYYENLSELPPEIRRRAADALANSKDRFEALVSHIAAAKELNLEDMKSSLRLHEGPVCVHKAQEIGKSFTFGSTVMVLSDPPELHLTPGSPCSTVYRRFTF